VRAHTQRDTGDSGQANLAKSKKFKPKTPKGVTREEMSGKSDAPARPKPKAAAPKAKAKGPFKLTPKAAPIPTPRPDPMTTGSTPAPYMYGSGAATVPGQSMAGTETAPAPAPYMYPATPPAATPPAAAPPIVPPFNPQMSDASILHTVPPELQNPIVPILDKQGFAGQEFAPRPPLPNPLAQMGGPAASPFTGGPTGPAPDQRAMLARMLGLGV
jgi:hypothetical protein